MKNMTPRLSGYQLQEAALLRNIKHPNIVSYKASITSTLAMVVVLTLDSHDDDYNDNEVDVQASQVYWRR